MKGQVPLPVSLGISFSPQPRAGSSIESEPEEFQKGDLCPQCKAGYLDYDGMLNLTCEHCGFTLAGCFT